MFFLADDHAAAERISNLLSTLKDREITSSNEDQTQRNTIKPNNEIASTTSREPGSQLSISSTATKSNPFTENPTSREVQVTTNLIFSDYY